MSNLSLARIMFGTNEDLHAPYSMNAARSSSLGTSRGDNFSSSASTGMFGKLLQKVWAVLQAKP